MGADTLLCCVNWGATRVAAAAPPCRAPSRRPLLLLWCVTGSAHVAYRGLVDVPMYWARWLSDEGMGRAYLSLTQGLADVSAR